MTRFSALTASCALMLAAALVAQSGGSTQFPEPGLGLLRDHPAIAYERSPSTDAVASLLRKVNDGAIRLTSDPASGYLRSLLNALAIPVESQLLVFSKTSFQAARIHPGNPRAIFFNDAVAVGWVPGGFIEIAAQDRQQGTIFYRLDASPSGEAVITRSDASCIVCHDTGATLEVPGLLARSVFTGFAGQPFFQLGSHVIDHRSPLDERWGGWYVTGTHGSMRHMGNALVINMEDPSSMITSTTLNLQSLEGRVDTHAYPSNGSDIAALMVFEHQAHMTNLIIRLGWESRAATYDKRPDRTSLTEQIKELVDYMLFLDEAPLTAAVSGTSGFAQVFAAQGPFDRQGRSLRQLALNGRLLRYPCSYLIYAEAFDALPDDARDGIYRRLWQILSGRETDKKYDRLTVADREAIIEILRDTKKDLPSEFR